MWDKALHGSDHNPQNMLQRLQILSSLSLERNCMLIHHVCIILLAAFNFYQYLVTFIYNVLKLIKTVLASRFCSCLYGKFYSPLR